MNAYDLANALEKRELEAMEYGFDKELFDATNMLRQQAEYIRLLEKLCNENGLGIGRNLLTGEVIPFPTEEK